MRGHITTSTTGTVHARIPARVAVHAAGEKSTELINLMDATCSRKGWALEHRTDGCVTGHGRRASGQRRALWGENDGAALASPLRRRPPAACGWRGVFNALFPLVTGQRTDGAVRAYG